MIASGNLLRLAKAGPGEQQRRRLLRRASSGCIASLASAPSAPAKTARRFQFVNYGEKAPKESICCDGLVPGAALDLSHWKGNKTPEHLYADTSTEIALNYIRGGCEPQAGPLIVNNHFDSDGALAVWALLNTTEALAHADLLVAAASAGDFNEWQEGGMGVHLDAALEALAEASGGAGGAKYDAVLPQISELLRSLNTREDLWGKRLSTLNRGLERVREGRVSVRVDPTGVAIVQHEPGEEELPPSVISRLLGGPSKTPGRILLASRRADGTFSYTPDAKALLARLGGLPWTDEGLPQMTDVLWTAGGAAVQQTPADVVRALTTED